MPELGDIRKGREIDHKCIYNKYIYTACVDCGKERWVEFRKSEPESIRCNSCAKYGKNHPNWKGGRSKSNSGYIYIWVDKDSLFAPMRDSRGCIREHRLVIAKHLGRLLESWEIVHHKNHIKTDNRIENLELLPSQTGHLSITLLIEEIKRLKVEIRKLKVSGGKL